MRHRRKVVPGARGRVLEVGMGSGLNLSAYDRTHVEKVWGIEPSLALQAVARERAAAAGIQVEFVGLSGEDIPADEASFDTVVTTWTLCSIPDAARALGEMRRVLRPAGRLVFAEHGIAAEPGVARWQHRLNPLWRRFSSGCNMNRSIPDLIREAGFEIEGLETEYLPGPKVLAYNYWGVAVRG